MRTTTVTFMAQFHPLRLCAFYEVGFVKSVVRLASLLFELPPLGRAQSTDFGSAHSLQRDLIPRRKTGLCLNRHSGQTLSQPACSFPTSLTRVGSLHPAEQLPLRTASGGEPEFFLIDHADNLSRCTGCRIGTSRHGVESLSIAQHRISS